MKNLYLTQISCFIILINCSLFKSETASAQTKTPTVEEVIKYIESGGPFNVPVENIFKVENKSVWDGTDSTKIRIYYPNSDKKQRIIFNIHGGALVAGDLNSHDNISRMLANKTNSIVIAVDYKKPPRNPFPSGINECDFVLKWIKDNSKSFGGDPNNIVLLGDSGGALFVAALVVKSQSNLIAKQVVLINPAVDLRDYEQSPYALVCSWYLNGQNPDNPLASPITAKTTTFFPPTLIVTCEKDFLKPQGLSFYDKLLKDGIKVKTIDIPNQDHLAGYWATGHKMAEKAIQETVNFILSPSNKQ